MATKQKVTYDTDAKSKHLSSVMVNTNELELDQSKAIILELSTRIKY
jgi:hypothetical protein